MSTKGKARLNGNGIARGSAGRPFKCYSIEDVIKLVGFSSQAALLKIDMVMYELSDMHIEFFDRHILSLRFLCTDLFSRNFSSQVIVNNLNVEMAMSACHLSGQFPLSTVYSRVAYGRKGKRYI
jgi:hypothetical protein